jgi:hypothetical protein
MKTSPSRRQQAGFVSYLLVLSTGAILTLLMVSAYRSAMSANNIASQVQLRVDYSEKEEAILRSIVAIAPNRAIRAMQSGSSDAGTAAPLSWQSIFTESLVLANARSSIDAGMLSSLDIAGLKLSNTGDITTANPAMIFTAINQGEGFVSSGINRSLGVGFPVPLTSTDNPGNDINYPIISVNKKYGALAEGGVGLNYRDYPDFNWIRYPQINFGYAKPGENFVAKRNWWAFSVDVGGNDAGNTHLARSKRTFVLSIYEIPSQLAISASSFMSLGEYELGNAWENVNIVGGVFAGKADVRGTTPLAALASRRGMTLSNGTTIDGRTFEGSPFTPGEREKYQQEMDEKKATPLINQTTAGVFSPVSLSSESGRTAFIPINRGLDFLDRFSQPDDVNVLSTTSWKDYSVGAQQCAMRLDITDVTSPSNPLPTILRFQYYMPDGTRRSMPIPIANNAVLRTRPDGYEPVGAVSRNFPEAVDLAYGGAGGYTFLQGISGPVTFDDATFTDATPGEKAGYWRPRAPFVRDKDAGGQTCITVCPERIPDFLRRIGAADVGPAPGVAPVVGSHYNNSLVVNVDYTVTGLNNARYKPDFPSTVLDYGLILQECSNLSSFTKGFSLVTNLKLYIGDDFNKSLGTPPPGYIPVGDFYPPCSLFAPEKRWGVEAAANPLAIEIKGQIGSLASDREEVAIRPLDSKFQDETAMAANQITADLKPITHPAELPPITMMNWLVVLEELRIFD